MNAAIMTGLLAAAFADLPIAELNALPSKAVCRENVAIAQQEICRYKALMSISPSRAELIRPALEDAIARKALWELLDSGRVCFDPDRIAYDYEMGPIWIRKVKDVLGEDAFIRREWPSPKRFP